VGSDSKNGVRHQRALSPRLSMMMMMMIDYRRLNSVTKQDSYPLPLTDNCLNALSGSFWYSTLDLRFGYNNIPITEEDRDKSAFVTCSDVIALPLCLLD